MGLKLVIYLVLKTSITFFSIEKVFKITLSKYLNFRNMFLKNLTTKLLECLSTNKYGINLEIHKKLLYKLIYSFKYIELNIFKTYTNKTST